MPHLRQAVLGFFPHKLILGNKQLWIHFCKRHNAVKWLIIAIRAIWSNKIWWSGRASRLNSLISVQVCSIGSWRARSAEVSSAALSEGVELFWLREQLSQEWKERHSQRCIQILLDPCCLPLEVQSGTRRDRRRKNKDSTLIRLFTRHYTDIFRAGRPSSVCVLAKLFFFSEILIRQNTRRWRASCPKRPFGKNKQFCPLFTTRGIQHPVRQLHEGVVSYFYETGQASCSWLACYFKYLRLQHNTESNLLFLQIFLIIFLNVLH